MYAHSKEIWTFVQNIFTVCAFLSVHLIVHKGKIPAEVQIAIMRKLWDRYKKVEWKILALRYMFYLFTMCIFWSHFRFNGFHWYVYISFKKHCNFLLRYDLDLSDNESLGADWDQLLYKKYNNSKLSGKKNVRWSAAKLSQ